MTSETLRAVLCSAVAIAMVSCTTILLMSNVNPNELWYASLMISLLGTSGEQISKIIMDGVNHRRNSHAQQITN